MSTSPRRHNRLIDEHRAALDLEQAVEENRAVAAVALALALSAARRDGLALPGLIREHLRTFDIAHEQVLDAREAEERAANARRAAEAEEGSR